jgi:fumarate reductase flavoprotein subunit
VYDLFVGPDKGFKKPKFGRNGAGVKMGYWAGGRIEPRPVATMGGNHQLPGGLGANFSQLLLNCEGKRYCNELYGDPVHAGFPGAQMKRGECYSIYDSEFTKFLENAVCSHGGFDRSDPVLLKRIQDAMAGAKASENGYFHYELGGALNIDIWCGNTVEELAKNAGLSEEVAKNMATSVKRYNELCEKGRDEDFGRLPSLMVPLNNPPYYLTKIPPFRPGFMLVTVGGLETDENQNVLDDAYERIPGLYATGNCCGRRFGPQYSTPIAGVSIGCAIVLGREAGIAAATL